MKCSRWCCGPERDSTCNSTCSVHFQISLLKGAAGHEIPLPKNKWRGMGLGVGQYVSALSFPFVSWALANALTSPFHSFMYKDAMIDLPQGWRVGEMMCG